MSRRVPTVASRRAKLSKFCSDDSAGKVDTCPKSENWCDGPDGDELPCFDCFNPHRDYNVGGVK